MRIQLNTKRQQRLRNSLLFLSFFLLCQAAFAQNNNDPDMPDFAKYKLNKEEFMNRRAEAIAMRRGIEKDKLLDPKLRLDAIRMMEEQKARLQASRDPAQVNLVSTAWTPIGPNPIPNGQVAIGPSTPVSGRVSAIAVHPTNANIAYVGTAQGGVYRTTDGGTTWTPILDGAASLAIGAIAISPSSPEIVYIGTGEATFSGSSFFGVGVYRINNASTTANVSGPFRLNAASADIFSGRAIGEIIVHPTNADIIFVASASGVGGILGNTTGLTLPSRGIYRCNNATSANPVFAKLTGLLADLNVSVRDIAIDPSNPNILIANPIAGGANQGGIYRTVNALAADPTTVTFTQTHIVNNTSTSELVIEFAGVHPAGDPDATFYAASGQGGGRVLKSINGGVTWTQTIANNFCNPQCFYDVAIAVDPTNPNTVYLGGSPTLVSAKSTNGAVSFTDNRTSVHVDTHVMTVSESNTSQVWLGTDGGIYKSLDAGLTWTNLNNSTFSATQFMSLALHPTDPVFTIGGTQDNGTNFINPSSVWSRVDGGDGGYTQIDQNAVNTTNVRQYHTYFNASNLQGYGTIATVGSGWAFRGCQTTGATVNGITCTGSINFYAPLERGPGNPNTIYYGSDRLYRSADQGLNHTVVSQNPIAAGVPISSIGISPQNDNVRIVGLNNGGLFGTSTGSSTLDNLDPGNTVPNNLIARTVIDPNSQTTAYVTLSSFGVASVWKTTNLNAPTPTWTAVATGLPQIPVDAIVIDPLNSNNIYVGTDIGVYASTDGGASWAPFGTGLPAVAVFGIGITAAPQKLRIATHGRGMWDIPLTTVAPNVTINQAAAQVDPTSASPINFTVVFDQPVTGFATGDVTLTGTAGATTGTVTGSGTTYNVAVSGMTSSGTVIATIPAGVCVNGTSDPNTASTSTDNTVTFNLPVAPSVTINQAAAQVDPTSVSPINFTVVFSEAVTGFTTGDVTLTGTAGATTGTVTGSGTTYNVAVSGMTGSGTVIATIAAGVANGTSLPNLASTSTDNTVTFNLPVAPSVTINQAAAQVDPTSVSPINFTVVFSEAVTGFTTGDVTLTGTAGATTGTVTGSGTTYNVAVSGMTGSGTVIATIAAGVANGTSLPNLASTSTDNTVTFTAACNILTAVFSNASTCNNNGTPADATDDFFTADVTVTFVNAPATGLLQFEPGNDAIPGGGALSVSVVGLTSPYTFTGVRFKADGTITIAEIEFSAQPTTCVITATGPTVSSCSGAVDPCSVITTLACGTSTSATLVGAGLWSPNTCGFATAGAEKVYSFTPTTTGIYSLQVTAASGGFVDYFYKAASGGCSATGWTCIDDISTPNTAVIGTLTAGVTYYVLLDAEVITSVTHTFQIICLFDPCTSIPVITCATPVVASTSGSGVWSPGTCGFSTAGQERVYSFTPATTGTYDLQVTAASGGFADYFYKAASGGCSSTGWTCIDDISSPTTVTIGTLTAGVTYYILFDSEVTTAASQTFQIICPVPSCILTCPGNITVSNTANQCGAVVNYPAPITSGTCGTVTSSPASGSFFAVGTTTVTVTSSAGPTCTFTVTVNDTQPPSITCPANVTVSCAAAVPGPTTAAVTVSDNCPGTTVVHVGDVISAQTCANRFTITRTYRATDVAGNTAECSQIITVNDVTPPTLTCPANITVSCAAAVPAPNTALVTGVSDNCAGVVTVTHVGDVISAQTCANRYTITRTYRATDVCGNFTDCIQTITVNDITNPTITACPAPVTVSCAAAVPAVNLAAVVATDNCAGAVTITHVGDVISAQTCANRFVVTRTYRATDVCGNFTNCVQTITVNDVTAPTITTCPANITVSCAAAVPAVNTASVIATDNCAGVVTITHIDDVITNQTCPNRYTLTRTYRATDVCGNFSQCTQIITVNDQTAPVITCPANISVTTPVGSCTAVVNFSVTATDNCAGAVTIVSTPASGTAFPIGTTTVTSTATDACGNSSSCTFTVTVADAQLPVITAHPQNRTVCAGTNATFSVTAITSPSANGPLAYQWQQWNGSAWVNISGATASSFTVSNATVAMNTNTFRVVVTGLCSVVISNAATLYVNPAPTVVITATPPPSILPNQTTTLNATTFPPGSGTFSWFFNGSVIPGATTSSLGPLNINQLGTYRVVYTDGNGCVGTSANFDVTGALSNQIWVYPNPNFGQFQVRFYNLVNEPATVNVFNAAGQKVYQRSLITGITTYTQIDIDLGLKANGMYIVQIVNGSGKQLAAKQIIVQN